MASSRRGAGGCWPAWGRLAALWAPTGGAGIVAWAWEFALRPVLSPADHGQSSSSSRTNPVCPGGEISPAMVATVALSIRRTIFSRRSGLVWHRR